MPARPTLGDRASGIRAWWLERTPDVADAEVAVRALAVGGYSNEILFARITSRDGVGAILADDRVVVRLQPSGPPLFPVYDLVMQASVQRAVAANGVPVALPITVELDSSWLGAPFLAMPEVPGLATGEVPTEADWLVAAPAAAQRRLHEAFLDALAGVHRTPWRETPLERVLPGARGDLSVELERWTAFARWAVDGGSCDALFELFAWCREAMPSSAPEPSVLWGDVRLGNVVFDERFEPAAILDWEMAAIGPAEVDLAWFTALSDATEAFFGARVEGFLTREEIVARHEARLGRAMFDLRWYEGFALARAASINVRTAIVAALATGGDLPDPRRNPVVRYARRWMDG